MFDFLNNSVMENRTRNKKTVRRLLDKYGTLDNFMQNSTMTEDLEYKLAQGDSIVDEVERERQAMNSLPKQQGSSLDDNDMMRNAKVNQYRNSLLQTTHDSYLFSNPLPSIGDRSTLKQYANNQLSSTQSNVSVGERISNSTLSNINNKYVSSDRFDDIYYSKTNEKGDVIYKGTDKHEGEFSNRENDLGGKTNYGITQFSLNEYNLWKDPLKKGNNFPIDVNDLKPIQAKQILDEMYYQRYGINKITNMIITRNVFDCEINQGTRAGRYLAQSINEVKGTSLPLNTKISQNLADIVNKLSLDDTIKINDMFTIKRMERYFESVDNRPKENINNLQGWYNRAISYYSKPEVFEKLYKDKVDYYIKKKYSHYYNGK